MDDIDKVKIIRNVQATTYPFTRYFEGFENIEAEYDSTSKRITVRHTKGGQIYFTVSAVANKEASPKGARQHCVD